MPGYDWQQYRERGEEPVARGYVMSGICDYLCRAVPDIAQALSDDLPPGVIRAVVMGAGGASVYYIQAASEAAYQKRNN